MRNIFKNHYKKPLMLSHNDSCIYTYLYLVILFHKMKFIYLCLVLFIVVSTVSANKLSNKKKTNKRDKRIVGGTIANLRELNYQILFERKVVPLIPGRDYVSICGGSILTERYILTAAHCINNTSQYRIRTGIYFRYDPRSQNSIVQQAIIHPGYNPTTDILMNDIAIIRLQTPLVFNEQVGPIRLPTTNSNASETFARLSGWGRVNAITTLSTPFLLYANVTVISNSDCQKTLNSIQAGIGQGIKDTHICTLDSNPARGAGSGDSGGALVQNGEVIGVVSWALLDKVGSPTVYTRVGRFVQWIKENIKD